MQASIRPATLHDISALAEIEILAALAFEDQDLPPERKLQSLNETELARSIEQRLSWVAEAPDATILGFVIATRIKEVLHILEMDVLPEHQRKGIGSKLAEVVADAAKKLGCSGLTLTTFSHVPWNRPFYEQCGFIEVSGHFLPHLADRLEAQSLSGLKNRVAMYRHVA